MKLKITVFNFSADSAVAQILKLASKKQNVCSALSAQISENTENSIHQICFNEALMFITTVNLRLILNKLNLLE